MNSSSINTRLFLEGREIDLDEDIEIPITYGLATVQDISKKTSPHTMTIKIPGTHNNNIAFNHLYDITSTGNYFVIPTTYTAKITNACPSLSVTAATLDGSSFSLPIANGFNSTSYHNQLSFTSFNVTVSGNTDSSGYIVYKVNGNVIGCNKITAAVTNYCFPINKYNYDDILEIIFQTTYQNYDGNIGISFDAKKKARAYVIQNGSVILSGYAQIREASSKNGLITYDLQVTSDIGGFSSLLQNARLEDLYTTIDVNGKVKYLDSPYDHQMTISNIINTWYGGTNYSYPLIDYGSSSTANFTNWYASNFRPAIKALDYWNLIFNSVGYSWNSTFLSSPYFASLIIPYSDGNMSLTNVYPVDVTTNTSSTLSYTVVAGTTPTTGAGLAIFDTEISDVNGVYSFDGTLSAYKYTASVDGVYNFSTAFTFKLLCTPSVTATQLVTPVIDMFIHYKIYNANGTESTSPTISPLDALSTEFPIAGITFSGNNFFTNTSTSDAFTINHLSYPITLTKGQYVVVKIAPVMGTSGTSIFPYNASRTTYSNGTISMVVQKNGTNTAVLSDLQVSRSPILDGATLKFIDFVPKNIKQIDFVQSIVKLFNLYPEPDKDIPNQINFYTRDEYFANQTVIDWTNKIDNNDNITIKPIPSLDAKQLLFSYKEDKDWFNKQYTSLYSNGTYGELRLDTGYQFSNSVKSVMDGSFLFSPTPLIQFAPQITNSEGPIEILNGPTTFPASDTSSDIIMASGYYAANGNVLPTGSGPGVYNKFSGTPFTNARVGVHVIYWGVEYIIKQVFNDYAFQVTDINGSATTLKRPLLVPASAPTQSRVSNTYYATNDGFQYKTNSNVVIPAIYDSSDNNVTHKPVKTNLRILFYEPISWTTNSFNTIYIQYTPIIGYNGNYMYWNSTTSNGLQTSTIYPWCGHIDNLYTPMNDLLFGKPSQFFFNIPTGTNYPTNNLFSRFWINSVNEITDEDCKLVEANLRLNSVDISNLDLSSSVQIANTRYRINSIKNYIPSDDKLTNVELIRVPYFQPVTSIPIINAGVDQSIMQPLSSITFAGTVSESGNAGENVTSTLWTQISGPNTATITSPTSLTSTVTGLILGTYVFQLYGIDNYGLSSTDTMSTAVTAHIPCTPSVTASNDGPITLPSSSVDLTGTASGCNGSTITTYAWTQVSGPMTPTITSPSSINTTVTGITAAGTYVFRLTITDNYSETNHSDTSVTVNPAINITLNNSYSSATVTGLTGAGTLTPTFSNIVGVGSYSGTFSAGFTGAITVTRTGTVPGGSSFHARLFKNGVQVGSAIQADSTSTYVFSSATYTTSDQISITLST